MFLENGRWVPLMFSCGHADDIKYGLGKEIMLGI